MYEISIVLPVYNEAACIQETLNSIIDFSRSRPSYHFFFIDDGSTDRTRFIVERAIAENRDAPITLISYRVNRGKGWAVQKGVERAQGKYICFIDSDLAYSLDHLERLVDTLQDYDLVIGCRNLSFERVKNVKLGRDLAGKVFNLISRKILNLDFKDMQAGLKGFRKPVAKDLFSNQKEVGYAFDAELLYLARKQGYRIGEIPVYVSEKHLKKTSKVDILMDSIKMLISLLRIRLRHRFEGYKKRYLVKL